MRDWGKTCVSSVGSLSEEDAKLWKCVTDSVNPLTQRARRPDVEAPFEGRFSKGDLDRGPYRRNDDSLLPQPSGIRPNLDHGRTPGVDKRTSQRLIKGRMSIDARLDLHGLTQEAARRDLVLFISRGYAHGNRCILVITGKGLRLESGEIGILRRAVPQWLNDNPLRPMILGFSHATPRDGGEGALYVLLKRKR